MSVSADNFHTAQGTLMSNIGLLIPKACSRWRGIKKGFTHERGWINQLKILAPFPLREAYSRKTKFGEPFPF
jgi:hypothetical protein